VNGLLSTSRARVAGLAYLARDTVSFAVCVCLLSPIARAEPTEAQIDQGREVYGDFCATCHGRDMVNPGGVTFDLRKFPKDEYERFRNAVLNGKPPAMPPWRDKVSDDDLKLLWAYVRSGG
jgi:mono/diheme cytochrome c family protein